MLVTIKMNNKILTLIIGIFLITGVMAFTITKSINLTLNEDISDVLISKNITNIQTYIYEENNEYITYKTSGDIRNKEIRIDKKKCAKTKTQEIEGTIIEYGCEYYINKSNMEIETELQTRLNSLINNIGEIMQERDSKIITSSSDAIEYKILEKNSLEVIR